MHPGDLDKIIGAVREVIVTELKPVKADIAVLKTDVGVLKTDMKSVKQNIDDLIETTSAMKDAMVTKDDLRAALENYPTKADLKKELAIHHRLLTGAIDQTRRHADEKVAELRRETNNRFLPLERRASITK